WLAGLLGGSADICKRAQSKRLSAIKLKRNGGVYDEGVVLKESRKAVFLGQPVVVIINAQKQIMPLRHEISQADFNVKASKIEVVESIVIKQLLTDIDQSVQRAGDSRLVKGCYCRGDDKIALRGALICRDKNEHAQCRDEPAQMRVKAKSHKRDHLLPGSPLMPLIFSAISNEQVENANYLITRRLARRNQDDY